MIVAYIEGARDARRLLEAGRRALAALGHRPAGLEPGQFISPHGLAVDSRGDIYVGEVSFTNWGRRGPLPPGLRSLQKLVRVP
jgi:hypothetical protein